MQPLESLKAATCHPRAPLIVALATMGVGTLLRLLGYWGDLNALWWDESSWVHRIDNERFGIRPPGFGHVSKELIDIEPTAQLVRLPSLAAGILSLPAFHWLTTQLRLPSYARLLTLFALAVHPAAVAFAKEFKPYSIELCVHIMMLASAAHYFRRPSIRRLLSLGACCAVGVLFAWNAAAVFVPLLTLLVVFQLKKARRADLVLTTVAAIAGVLGLYVLLGDRIDKAKGASNYWAKKYGVFFRGDDVVDQLKWTLERTLDLSRLPWDLHPVFPAPDVVAQAWGLVSVALVTCGAWELLRKRLWIAAGLLLGPWLIVIGTNIASLWPYGVFRTNLFLLAYPLGISAFGIRFVAEQATSLLPKASGKWAIAGILTLPFLPVDLEYFRIKDRSTGAESTSVPSALRTIEKSKHFRHRKHGQDLLMMDAHACASQAYYRHIHPEWRQHYRKTFRKRLRLNCGSAKSAKFFRGIRKTARRRSMWVLVSQTGHQKTIQKKVERFCDVEEVYEYPTGDVLLRCGKKRRPR